MPIPKKTTNSLSDLITDNNFNFTEPVKNPNKVDKKGNDSGNSEEIAKKEAKAKQNANEGNLTDLEQEDLNNNKNQEIRKGLNAEISNLNNMNSLFDKSATIDYARYVESSDGSIKDNWKTYNIENPDTDGEFKFQRNSTIDTKFNKPIPYNNDVLDNGGGLTIGNLVKWSEKYPALQLKPQDFAYCKLLGYYPNNRLIVLRRFKAGTPDDLFDYVNLNENEVYNTPLSTMITWWKPEDEIGGMRFKFNENWGEATEGVFDTLKSIAEDFKKTKVEKKEDGDTSKIGNVLKSTAIDGLLTSLISDSIFPNELKKDDGLPFSKSTEGSPNLIRDSKKRKTGGEGLKSTINFNIEFEYELRDINGVDPSIAFMDLMNNSMRMGTSTGEYKYNIGIFKDSKTIKALLNGDIQKASHSFSDDLSNLSDKIGKEATDLINNLGKIDVSKISDSIKDLPSKALQYLITRYREELKGAFATDLGLPNGTWHLTIGNPQMPIISCGDLIISDSTFELGQELGYNDFPNSFKISYELETAQTRGRDRLSQIFNAGRGRVYTYKDIYSNLDYGLYSNGNNNEEAEGDK